jgi:hypothetical protein
LLSTPLTLCLVVLASHVDRLQFIDVMLGDQPALTPEQAAYQRMLTGDPIEAIEQARSFLKEGSVEAYYEEIVLGALRLAASDASLGRLDDKRLENIHQTVSEIVDDLGSYKGSSDEKPSDEKPRRDGPKGKAVDIEPRKSGPNVFCMSGLGRLDDCVAVVLADFLKRRGVVAKTAAAAAIENNGAETICVCFLEDVTAARADFTIRKLSPQVPAAEVVVCLLGDAPNGVPKEAGADAAPRSLAAVMTAIEKRLSVSTAGNNKRHPRVQAPETHPRDFDHAER